MVVGRGAWRWWCGACGGGEVCVSLGTQNACAFDALVQTQTLEFWDSEAFVPRKAVERVRGCDGICR